MVGFLLLGFLAAIFFLIQATDHLIELIRVANKQIKLPRLFVSSFILALVTSLPELVVGVVAAIERRPSLSLGTVLGSNVADLTLVIGLAVVLGGRVGLGSRLVFPEMWATGFLALAPFLLLLDGGLSRYDGLVLLLTYGFYYLFLAQRGGLAHLQNNRPLAQRQVAQLLLEFLLWVAVLIASAELVVRSSVEIAVWLKVPVLLIGMIFLPLGTTLPELMVELRAAQKREPEIFFGNVLGSIVVNSTVVLGLTALIYPLSGIAWRSFYSPGVFLLLGFLLLPLFLRSKDHLDRREGAVLGLIYLAFFLWQVVIK